MAKSKHGRALFDLLPKDGREASEVLRGRQGSGRSRTADPRAAIQSPTAVDDDRALDGVPRSVADRARFVELDGARIRLSFTSFTAGVAIFGVMVLLLGAYELGHRSGDTDGYQRGHAAGREWHAAGTMSEIEAARRQPVNTELVEGLFVEEPMTAAEPAPSVVDEGPVQPRLESKWVRGYTYVVAQEFSAGRDDDARRAAAFLLERGVATELIGYPSGAMQLITAQGYDRTDAVQRRMADELRDKVRSIGTQYFAAGGGYRLEGYFKTLTGDNW